MTKKDFQLIANALKESRENWSPLQGETSAVISSVALTLARHLRASNPRFDSDRFLDACGVPEVERNQ